MKITISELQAELDKYRPAYNREMTEEQKQFLKLARENERPVPFSKLVILWEQKGWGKYSCSGLQLKYQKIKQE
jgi:hypothetical protein